MSSQYYVLLPFAAALLWLFVTVYVMVPIKSKNRPLMELDSHFLTFDPNALGPEVAAFFFNHVQILTAQGLEVVQYLTKPNAQTNLTSVVIYMVDRRRGERCTVACFYVTVNGVTNVRGHHVILTTRLSDDSSVVTSNTSTPGVFRPRPNVDGVSLSTVTDPGALLDIHRFRVESIAAGKTPLIPPRGAEIEDFEAYETAAVDYQVMTGLAVFDAARRTYYRSWYGTFYMTWQLLWPFKQLNLAKKRRKAAKAMADYQRGRGLASAGL